MKFGKVYDIKDIDFSLPPDSQFNSSGNSVKKDIDIFIGATGWSMKEWVGHVYPQKSKSKDFLHHYTRQFNTIELNTTHYRIPAVDTINKWREQSAVDFHFCPKIPQTISHSRDLDASDQFLSLFCERISGLEDKLGCCFIQLPPYFDHSRLALLEHFLKRFPQEIPLAVELRHESWFASDQSEWLDLLQRFNRSAVVTDVAGRRDVLHMGLSNTTTMIRFVGNNLHPTDQQRAEDWARRLLHWSRQGLQKAYIFTHEPDNILAPELADIFCKSIQQEMGHTVRGPEFIKESTGEQMKLF